MYSVSTGFQTAIVGSRDVRLKAYFNAAVNPVPPESMIDVEIEESINGDSGVSMGSACSAKLTMNMWKPTVDSDHPQIDYASAVVKPYIGIYTDETTVEYVPMGVFNLDTMESSSDYQQIKITAYDNFYKTDKAYTPLNTIDVPLTTLLSDICSQCNITLATAITSDIVIPNIKDGTCRQQIGWIAGLLGKNARFNRTGELEFVWYTSANNPITLDLQTSGGLKQLSDSQITVTSLTSGTSDNVITAGVGDGLSFENPYMTQAILNTIVNNMGTFVYTPLEVKWRGNPAIQAGDILSVSKTASIALNCPVTQTIIKASTGLSGTIKCSKKDEETTAFVASPSDAKINAVYKGLQEAVTENTNFIKGANGGIFQIIDANSDGVNDGWIIKSADSQKHIIANINGIGLTTNGGTTYATAITPTGINASTITAGQMNADRIKIGDGTLSNVIALADGVVGIKNANNEIIATFSDAGAYWKDMQEMEYCGFVWKKSVFNNNVRFTKKTVLTANDNMTLSVSGKTICTVNGTAIKLKANVKSIVCYMTGGSTNTGAFAVSESDSVSVGAGSSSMSAVGSVIYQGKIWYYTLPYTISGSYTSTATDVTDLQKLTSTTFPSSTSKNAVYELLQRYYGVFG